METQNKFVLYKDLQEFLNQLTTKVLIGGGGGGDTPSYTAGAGINISGANSISFYGNTLPGYSTAVDQVLTNRNGSVSWGPADDGSEKSHDISGYITVHETNYIGYVKATVTGSLVQITVVTKSRAVPTSGNLIPKFTKLFTIGTTYRPASAVIVSPGLQFCLAPTSDISSATSGFTIRQSGLIVKEGTGQVYNLADIAASSYNVSIPTSVTFSYYTI